VNTRSIAVRATVPNENESLYPGLFADVQVILPQVQNVITVPQSAVTYSLYGDSIYVIEQKGKNKKGEPQFIAVQKYVKTGERRDNVVAILSGINVGDEVVTSGQLKLHPNSTVVINNTVNLQ
jgi:membrane fusion protein (multidrug efflux system)